MQHLLKRTFSIALALVMVLGLFAGIPMPAKAATSTYEKITTAPTDWSGTYLIVYEDGNVAFNGGLAKLDVVSNTIAVTITDNTIAADDTTNAAAFTIASVDGGYTIQSASGYYVGQASNANGLTSNQTTTYTNTLSANEDGTINIISGGAYLRYNAASNQTRFRYYKSSSYTNQKAICLYKLVEEGGSTEPVCKHANATSEVTTPATCFTAGVTTWTCPDCDAESWTEAAPAATGAHTYTDGVCTVCGIQELDGKNVVIYAPAYNMAFSATKTGNYNVGVAVTITDGVMNGYGTTETWTVTKNDDGTYSFANGGQNIGMADSYSSVNLGTVNDKWEVIYLGNSLYNIKNVVRGNYLEWYSSYSNWSTYNSSSAATDDQYQLSFYIIPEGACTHENATSEVTTPVSCNFDGEKTWTCECGYSWTEAIEATGHTFENDVCTVCKPTNIPTASADILTAANALVAGDSLPYLVTLTGQIVSVDTAYSEQYGNITVTIQVSGSETSLQCYRLTATDADLTDDLAALAVGQIITVKGELMNYNGSIQFGAGSLLLSVEAAPTYTITFVTPSGITAPSAIENTVALPTAEAPDGYTFLGWTAATVDNVTDKPEYYEAGEVLSLIESDTTLNALYSRVQGGEGSSNVVFEFGDNVDTTTHSDGSAIETPKSYTSGSYTLEITEASKVYDGANDATGNSALKLGTGSALGSFSFTVPADATKVIINASGYKANTGAVSINDGSTITIPTTSNSGKYTPVEVDTSTNKVLTISSVNDADKRLMIDSITYVVGDAGTTYYTTVISAQEDPVAFKFDSASLTLEEGISLNFKVDKEVIDTYGVENVTIGFTAGGKDYSYTYAVADVPSVDNQYIFTLYNIRPDWMNVKVTASMTASDGTTTATKEYSVRQYCDNMLAEYPDDTKLITLLTDLLNYGAAAQAFTENTDTLANNGWTGASTTTDTAPTALAAFENNGDVKWATAALFLRETTRLYFTVTTEYADAMVVKYTVGSGEEQTLALAAGERAFFIDGLTTLQMRTNVSITICDAEGNALSGTLVYRVENYVYNAIAANENANLVNMLKAMLRVGDAAIAYAAN